LAPLNKLIIVIITTNCKIPLKQFLDADPDHISIIIRVVSSLAHAPLFTDFCENRLSCFWVWPNSINRHADRR